MTTGEAAVCLLIGGLLLLASVRPVLRNWHGVASLSYKVATSTPLVGRAYGRAVSYDSYRVLCAFPFALMGATLTITGTVLVIQALVK
jgi:hypothetical protein